jgi:protein TonB
MRRAAIEGTAVVVVAIQADGSVGEVRLRQSAGHAELDAAAVEAVKRWRFAPAQRRGVAVQFCCVEIPIAFRLH